MLAKIYKTLSNKPSVLLKYTDGGTDQRNTLESVKVATICLFKELGLDMIITGRCAPSHSYTNPAERIMSILNIGLQNCATERERDDDEFGKAIKSCNSMHTRTFNKIETGGQRTLGELRPSCTGVDFRPFLPVVIERKIVSMCGNGY